MRVALGIPHCYTSGTESSQVLLQELFQIVRALASSLPRGKSCSALCELWTNWLKVHESIGHESAFERKRTTVYDRMRFVQDHVARPHSNVFRDSVMTYYFEWPRFVNVLVNVDYTA